MNWLAIITSIVAKFPVERLLIKPRDSAKSLEEFANKMAATGVAQTAPPSEAATPVVEDTPLGTEATQAARGRIDLPTTEETTQELKRRLGKELYRAELDLANKLRIAGKPCDCLEAKHSLGLEATAEELISQEPGNPVYAEIIVWIKQNRPKVTIEAISSGRYDEEYPQMAAEFKAFRKRIMGTTALTAMIETEQQITGEKESNPSARVRFDRADIDSAIAAARRLKSDRNLYVFATHLGYTIDERPPPGMQQYVVVHPDGTTETIKPGGGSNPMEYVTITDPGQTTFKVGEVVSREAFEKENERVKKLGEKPATGR